MTTPLPKFFRRFPKPFFRINAGPQISLRPKRTADAVPRTTDYDIITTGLQPADSAPVSPDSSGGGGASSFVNQWLGATTAEDDATPAAPRVNRRALLHEHVEPRIRRAEDGGKTPNGLRLRLNTAFTRHYFLRQWRGESPIVFAVQEGTPVPEDLVLVRPHPDNDEWFLEPARRMTLQELNDHLNTFLTANAAKLTRKQWDTAYPHATEPHRVIPVPAKFKIPSHNRLASVVRRGFLYKPQRKQTQSPTRR